MKHIVILLALFTVSLLSVNHAYGIWIPQSPEELLEESQVIVVGTITSVKELELEQPIPNENSLLVLDQYTVTVEEFVKNPQNTDTITVQQPTISTPGRLLPHGGFEIGDRVLFYIESFDGTNTYSKESFLIPKQCDTSSVIHEPRIIGSDYIMIQNGIEKRDNFTANLPIQFVAKSDMDTLSGASMEYDVYISKQVGKIYKDIVFNQTITADAKPCEWLSVAEWAFTPDTGNYLLNGRVYKVMSNFSISNKFFSVLPETPLNQYHSGITFDQIQCKPNLVLIQKYDGSPSCVTEQTKQKLIERGWTKDESKITVKDYKIDCNNQTNPYQEYECFKDAYSNCDVATVNPEIYTIEGDPIYTTLTITPDCKIQGVADMSTDRFWGTPKIIATQCDKIIDDEYMWAVKNCDAKNLPEMQFNFEMQLYPKILECEENGNTWSRETLSCLSNHDASSESIWKKYITVSASRNDDPALADALPVYSMGNKTDNDLLHDLLFGADGCKNETEVCKISDGISLDRTYSFLPNIMISDNDQYTITIDIVQAEQLRAILDWKQSDGSFYSVVHFDGKQYFLTLSTFDSEKRPDVKMDVLGTFAKPVALEKGHALNYTIVITAWSTYGADAKIDLMAVQDAKDSGIDVWIEPSIITVPERSNATATLFIKAQDNANDGIYDIRVIGHANGKLADLYCSNTICPTVNIGDSDWSIRTFGSGTNIGIGGSQHPENTWMELELNKNEFFEGDMVEINAYLVNNGTEKIEFVPDTLLIKVIKAQPVGYYENLYGIDARYESDKQIVLEPNSKTPLVRTFYWNQNTFQNFDDEQRVDVRQHKMIAKFVGDNYAWNGDMWFGIR